MFKSYQTIGCSLCGILRKQCSLVDQIWKVIFIRTCTVSDFWMLMFHSFCCICNLMKSISLHACTSSVTKNKIIKKGIRQAGRARGSNAVGKTIRLL